MDRRKRRKLTRKRHTHKIVRKPFIVPKEIEDGWDRKLSIKENYERLGLLMKHKRPKPKFSLIDPEKDVSQKTVSVRDLKKVKEQHKREIEKVTSEAKRRRAIARIMLETGMDSDEAAELYDSGSHSPPKENSEDDKEKYAYLERWRRHERKIRVLKIPKKDVQTIKELIQKYGDDYEKMERDRKINIDQLPKSRIKKLCEIYVEWEKSMKKDAQEGAKAKE